LHEYDRFDYTKYYKYSSNNGTATGVGVIEACIHGINELIERDATGLFLLSTFISINPSPLRLIRRKTLPLGLQELWDRAEAEIACPIRLLDITSDIEVPTCLAVARSPGLEVSHYGAGTSLDRSYAIERALLEVVQVCHLYADGSAPMGNLDREDAWILTLFDRLPRYQQCVRLDLEQVIAETAYTAGAYDDLPTPGRRVTSLEEYLDLLLDRLAARGYTAYRAVHFESTHTGIVWVDCVVPGLERFHLVRWGAGVLPGVRGQRMLASQAG